MSDEEGSTGGGDEQEELEAPKTTTQGKTKMDPKTKLLAARNAKRRQYLKYLKYAILLGVALWYIIFGAQKLDEADTHPSTKFQTRIVKGYEVPVVAACLDVSHGNANTHDTDARFEVGEIIMNGNEYICQFEDVYTWDASDGTKPPNCVDLVKYVDISEFGLTTGATYDATRPTWQLVRDRIGNSGADARGDQHLECSYVVPPKDLKDITDRYGGMKIELLIINLDGVEAKDTNLETNSAGGEFKIPTFLTEQYDNSINYWAFHPDELDYTIQELGESVHDAMWELGQSYYGTAFSFNSLTLVLNTATFPDGTESKGYTTLLGGAPLISYHEERFTYQSQVVAGMEVQVLPQTIANKEDKGFVDNHLEYYKPYEAGDFIAGIGGAVAGVAGTVAFFLGIIMFGAAVGPLVFSGWAPVPGRKPGQLDMGKSGIDF